MIKLNKLPDEVMDVVMETARDVDMKPELVVVSMLRLVKMEDAKNAAIRYKRELPKN
jgi:hypothetical protein